MSTGETRNHTGAAFPQGHTPRFKPIRTTAALIRTMSFSPYHKFW